MAGNSIGQLFRVTTFGESHGVAIGCIVDGCPPGIEISVNDIQKHLNLRKPGFSRFTTSRKEPDSIQILSGIFEGKTTGTPIGLLIKNIDHRPKDYSNIKDRFRPGHADYPYFHKYGFRDYRGGGRASARETAVRVAAGAIAKKVLKEKGIEVYGYVSQIGNIKIEPIDLSQVYLNPFFCPDLEKIPLLESLINQLREERDSIGAKITLFATGIMPGLGEPVFDRLEADLAHGLMSINAVKGFEIGDGFSTIIQKGSEHRDKMIPDRFLSNHAGGVVGGISTGQDLIAHIALKPTSSISKTCKTIDESGNPVDIEVKGRHDPCVGMRAVPIAEAMMAITILDHYMRNRAQNADVTVNTPVLY